MPKGAREWATEPNLRGQIRPVSTSGGHRSADLEKPATIPALADPAGRSRELSDGEPVETHPADTVSTPAARVLDRGSTWPADPSACAHLSKGFAMKAV